MRKILGALIALAVVLALALPKLKSRADAEDAAGSAPPPPAPTLKVSVERAAPRELVERLATTGSIRANERVELVSEISGKIAQIFFTEGSRVAAGQVLLKIDDQALQAEHERISFRVALAERQEARQRELLEQGVISQDGYDLALNQLNVLRSELRVNEAQLLKTEIRAPFAGVVGLRYVSPGSYLSPATRIATLQDLSSVKLDFSVPEKYSGRMRRGSEVAFTVKGSEQDFRGQIYAIEPSVDPDTRSLLLRARCPNPEGILVPGAFADVRLVVQRVEDALTVPAMAIIPELGGKKVFVLEDGTAQPRQVTTGIRTDDRVEVVTGLEPGEQVITSAIQQLRPGLEVEAES